MGGDEVAERDKHWWELDPASSDDCRTTWTRTTSSAWDSELKSCRR